MRTKELGSTGIQVPEIGIGTYQYKGAPELLRTGLELGATLIDTAESYQNEKVVGEAIKGIRERVFLATKVSHWRYHEVIKSADASLQRLGTNVIDLYQIHWPNAAVAIEETMAAMEALVDRGKVRYIGVSNFTLPELKRAQKALKKYPIAANQVRYGITHRTIEPRLLPYCKKERITIIAFSSLGHDYTSVLKADRRGSLAKVAKAEGRTVAQVALNWCVAHEGVITIPKTESPSHMRENCQSSDWRLSDEQTALLDRSVSYYSRGLLELAARRFVRGSLQRIRARKNPLSLSL